MERILFDTIFDAEIAPLIMDIEKSDAFIKMKDLNVCKEEIFRNYREMNNRYKAVIFGSKDVCLLDRHKIAACVCGAFLKTSVFYKDDLVERVKEKKEKMEAYFYYVNELVAFLAACRFMSFFIANDNKDNPHFTGETLRKFPVAPPVKKNKKGVWTSVLFNLSQIKDKTQIGLEHYDMYSYAMFFFFLEQIFYEEVKLCS